MELSKQTILVAGAAGALGQAVSLRMLHSGAHLALVDRSVNRLREMYPDLDGSAQHRLIECIDMTSEPLVANSVDQALKISGRIDAFISVVGGFQAGTPLHETPPEVLDGMLALNVKTFHIAMRAVVPEMLKAGGGKIVAVGARPALRGMQHMAAYSASKSALLRLVESLAEELKGEGINVNCVLPGTMDTPQNRRTSPDADTTRWVSPASVADVIAFLISPAARDVHGACLPVYGLS